MTHRPLDILLVDDEPPITSTLSAALERRGHCVRTAESAEKALALRVPEVLVCDVGLPGASGLELLASLHERGSRPHTVIVTGHPTLEDCRRALHLCVAEFLSKPFRLQDLIRAVEACPERSRERADERSRSRPETRSSSSMPVDGEDAAVFERTYVSAPACVQRVACDLAAFALVRGVGPSTRARIASAASEIVDNACRHGYADGRGRIFVAASLEDQEIVVKIRDEGAGFAPEAAGPDRLQSQLTHGLARALALSEDVHVESSPGRGTRVVLRFTAGGADFAEEGCVDLCERDFLTPDLSRQVLRALQRPETSDLFRLPPSLAVVVGRLLAGPDPEPIRPPFSK